MRQLLILVAILSGSVFAQTNTCQFSFNFDQRTGFTSQPAPTAFDNRLRGCNGFTMNYQATGLSAVNVTLQSAGGAGTSGAFGTYSGTVVSGTNPATSTTGTQTEFSGYVGWLRVLVSGTPTGSTWQISGTVYGAQTGGAGAIGGAPTECLLPGSSACYTQGPDASGTPPAGRPFQTANFNGTNVARDISCPFQAVTILAPGTTGKIVVNTATGKTVKICHIHETSGASSANATIRSGTSLQCAAGTATIDGVIGTTGFVFDYGPKSPLSGNAANDDICMDFSGSITATIEVIYAEI